MKDNIIELEDGLSIIDNINSYSFNFKGSDRLVYGVIAQEIEKILPHLVTEKDGIKRVDYMQFTPILIKSVKELKEDNKNLNNRLLKLEDKLERLMKLLE